MRILQGFISRLFYSLILLLFVLVLNFTLIHLTPGDPAQVIAGQMGGATEEILNEIRAAYGLDKPFSTQLFTYLGKVLHGDLGFSFYFNGPVSELILQRVPATILLVVSALFFSVCVGTFLGVLAAKKPNGILSYIVTVLALLGYSAPVFWTGMILLIVFAGWLPLFPASGMADVTLAGSSWLAATLDVMHHLVLPMFTLGIIYVAQFSRLARASMLDVMGSDYIRTARAKGVSETKVIYKHALRNAVLPVVTMTGLQMSYLFSGAVLVETVFNWPGMGRLAFDSILRRDHPTILGILFLSTFIVVAANLVTDLSYRIIDPRIRAGN